MRREEEAAADGIAEHRQREFRPLVREGAGAGGHAAGGALQRLEVRPGDARHLERADRAAAQAVRRREAEDDQRAIA